MHTLLWKSLEDLGQGASYTAVLPAFSEQWGKGCWSHLRWPQLSLGPLAATLPEFRAPNLLPSFFFFLIYLLFIFGHEACGNLSSPARDRIPNPCIGRKILNDWTTREVLSSLFLKAVEPFWESVQAHVCFSWWYLCHLWFGAKEFNSDPLPWGWFSCGFSQVQV